MCILFFYPKITLNKRANHNLSKYYIPKYNIRLKSYFSFAKTQYVR